MATLYDYHNTGDNSEAGANPPPTDDRQFAQTFTTTAAYTIKYVKLKVFEDAGSGNDVVIEIQGVDENDKPDGSAIATGTIADLPDAAAWVRCDFVIPVALADGSKYAIVFIPQTGTNSVYWRTDTNEAYADGSYVVSNDGGSTWDFAGEPPQNDFMFECYGDLTEEAFAPPADKVTVKKLIAFANNKLFYET